jgi:hypothetical protein
VEEGVGLVFWLLLVGVYIVYSGRNCPIKIYGNNLGVQFFLLTTQVL